MGLTGPYYEIVCDFCTSEELEDIEERDLFLAATKEEAHILALEVEKYFYEDDKYKCGWCHIKEETAKEIELGAPLSLSEAFNAEVGDPMTYEEVTNAITKGLND
jgi:hypothetical protein